jgi:hypothetical protein
VPAGSGELVVIAGGGLIVKENVLLSLAPTLSNTWTMKLNVPVAVGVPLSTPVAELRASPGGGAELVGMDQK